MKFHKILTSNHIKKKNIFKDVSSSTSHKKYPDSGTQGFYLDLYISHFDKKKSINANRIQMQILY